MCWACFSLLVVSHLQQPADPPSAEQIVAWVDQLNDPAFGVRQAAVAHLYASGPAALQALDAAVRGSDYESALSARRIIERIQKLFLVGAEVELTASRRQFDWDEPVSLRVTIRNPSDFPIHLPFLIQDRETIDADALARQVGNLLDAADYLEVLDPEGRALAVVVDDYRGHPELTRAIDTRVSREPASLLPPHQHFVLTLTAFNRGFGRYRLLQAGAYRVRFAYVPEWDDPTLRQRGLGMVRSDVLTVTVTTGAPPEIIQADGLLSARLSRADGTVAFSLVNVHDRPLGVNLNLGNKGLLDHARIEWGVRTPAGVDWFPQPIADAPGLQPERLVTLQPGEARHVFRLPLAEFPPIRDGTAVDSIDLAVRYANTLERATVWRRMAAGAAGGESMAALLQALPLPTFVGHVVSDFLTVPIPSPAGRSD